jgi:short-subunit dehydrogenase
MPFIISPKKAAEEIIKGLKCKKFEIHFPKKFTFILKFLRILHVNIFLKIVEKFIFKKSEKSK